MKFNKWTLGLATVGAVSLASAARADEKMNSLQTALSNTTISGYVSASMNYQASPSGTGARNSNTGGGPSQELSPANGIPFQGNKQNGFNLDVVSLTISKPEDESPWASGYTVQLWFGPDAVGWNSPVGSNAGGGYDSNMSVKNAYVTLRTPVGNGIDWKVGVFDTVVGYEAADASNDPNYTRSWGWAIEPTEHTGVLATYKISDELTVSAGIANTLMAGINQRAVGYTYTGGNYNYNNEAWNKTILGSATFTAPTNWGWAAGSSFYAGFVWGFNNAATSGNTVGNSNAGNYASGDQANYYAGMTLNTPWKQLTAGLAFDYAHNLGGGVESNGGTLGYHFDDWVVGAYGTYKATDKLSFSGRAEFYEQTLNGFNGGSIYANASGYELTGTMEYDLWANVISRLEVRYDHLTPGSGGVYGNTGGAVQFAGGPGSWSNSSVGIYANVIYKF